VRHFAWVTAALLLCSTTAYAGTVQRETHGGREFRVYTPDGDVGGKPLVVVLHGCTQTADDVAEGSRMDAVADEKGFVVVYPEQSAASGLNRCWEWWDAGNQKRDAGEPKEIADGVASIVDAHVLDGERVYVAGISAGGAMSVVLGATYPDRFAAIGVLAGVEYAAASALSGVYSATSGGGPDPAQQGERAHAAMGSFARVVPALVIHGSADGVVAPINGEQVAKQWLKTNTLVLGENAIAAPTTSDDEAGYPYTRTIYASKERGGSVVEHILVKGLAHAWPGGKDGGSYADPKGPDASRTLWAFFEKRTLSQPIPEGPTQDPPASGRTSNAPAETSSSSSPSNASDGGGCAMSGHEISFPTWLVLLAVIACSFGMRRRSVVFLTVLLGCSSNEATAPSPATDAGSSTPPKDAGADRDGSPVSQPDAGPGETCVGYGEGESCGMEQGKPYGYVCFGGPPPGVDDCKLKQSSSLGSSYCCSENVCVEQIDQSAACSAVTGKPHRFQCPPTATGNATPAADCVEHNSGSSSVEKYYCCP
jgi:poly(hydroxyalkanoate) depolymerase family esterase